MTTKNTNDRLLTEKEQDAIAQRYMSGEEPVRKVKERLMASEMVAEAQDAVTAARVREETAREIFRDIDMRFDNDGDFICRPTAECYERIQAKWLSPVQPVKQMDAESVAKTKALIGILDDMVHEGIMDCVLADSATEARTKFINNLIHVLSMNGLSFDGTPLACEELEGLLSPVQPKKSDTTEVKG